MRRIEAQPLQLGLDGEGMEQKANERDEAEKVLVITLPADVWIAAHRYKCRQFVAVDRSIPGIYIGIGDRFSDLVGEEVFVRNDLRWGGITLQSRLQLNGRHTRYSPRPGSGTRIIPNEKPAGSRFRSASFRPCVTAAGLPGRGY